MKLIGCLMGAVIFFLAGGILLSADAPEPQPEKISHIQLSLFPPIQLASVDTTIKGFRLGVFTMNRKMEGLDIGLLNWTTQDLTALEWGLANVVGGDAAGVQFSFVNIDCGDMVGWDAAVCNVTLKDFVGFQSATVNVTGKSTVGVQFSAVNYSSEMTGLQLGLLNITGKLAGIQLGVINIASNGFLPVFPIINAAF
ncbi:MAG: hypothetical protein RAO92_01480 [Candidatus Euphemobacter frigidus]|nr:hypothetical protein [Candidatus Euphemobacter frigidus]MDP8275052.1 hypothetical protein [Candidatus Euphemobacter frigidus]